MLLVWGVLIPANKISANFLKYVYFQLSSAVRKRANCGENSSTVFQREVQPPAEIPSSALPASGTGTETHLPAFRSNAHILLNQLRMGGRHRLAQSGAAAHFTAGACLCVRTLLLFYFAEDYLHYKRALEFRTKTEFAVVGHIGVCRGVFVARA